MENVEIFVWKVVYCFTVVRRVVVDMVLSEFGEESFFIRQVGGAFRIHSLRVRRGARRSPPLHSFFRGRCRSVGCDVRGFSSVRYEHGLVITVRWDFVVNRFVVISRGGQDAREGVGNLLYEARAVLNGEDELEQPYCPSIRRPGESEIVISLRWASWYVFTVYFSPSMYGRGVVTLHKTE